MCLVPEMMGLAQFAQNSSCRFRGRSSFASLWLRAFVFAWRWPFRVEAVALGDALERAFKLVDCRSRQIAVLTAQVRREGRQLVGTRTRRARRRPQV